jgi:hypothetical protein
VSQQTVQMSLKNDLIMEMKINKRINALLDLKEQHCSVGTGCLCVMLVEKVK